MKASQKLDLNQTIYGQNWCNKSILVKFSQNDLHCIQITKHTSNV